MRNLMSGPPEMMNVYENKEANNLIDIYSKEFEAAFGIKPIFDQNNYHIGTFKDIAASCKGEGPNLVRHFFKMKDDWFQKQGYSHECLRKHLPNISIDYKRRGHVAVEKTTKLQMMISCDICFHHFNLTCTADFLTSGARRVCGGCSEKQNTGPSA